jgi:hypothetical protein
MATKYEIKLSDATEAGVFTVKSAGTAAWKKTAELANKDYTSIVTVDGDASTGYTITGEDDKQVSIGGTPTISLNSVSTGSKDDIVDASKFIWQKDSSWSISTGAGNDTVTGATVEGVTYDLGDGNDVIEIGTDGKKATIDAGAGNDSLKIAGEGTQVTLGDGKDTISIGAKNVNITDFDWANDTIQLADSLLGASLTTDGGWGNAKVSGTVEGTDTGFYAVSTSLTSDTQNFAWVGSDGTTVDVSSSKSKSGFYIYSNLNDENGDSVIGSRQADTVYAGSNDTIDGGRGDDSISIADNATAVTVKLYDGSDSDSVTGFTTGFDDEADIIYVDSSDALKKASITGSSALVLATGKARVSLGAVSGGTGTALTGTTAPTAPTTNDSLNVKLNVAGTTANVQFFKGENNAVLNSDANYVWSMDDDGTLFLANDSTDYTIDLGNSTNYGDTRMYHNVSNVNASASNGNVVLVSGSKAASLTGGKGSSTLIGAGSKGDVLIGGSGNDVYEYAAGYGKDTISGYSYEDTDSAKNGADSIHFAAAASGFSSNGTNVTMTFNSDSSQTLTIAKVGANDKIRYTIGDDTVATVAKVGSSKAANKFTFEDDVTLYVGGAKTDTVTVGADTYDKTNIWLDNSGTDKSAQYYGVEVVDASATTADVVIAGTSANETLKASKGSSSLNGGAGNDVLYGNKSGDTTFWFGAKGGKDTIMSSNTTDKVLLYDYDTTDINASACKYGTDLTLAFNDGSTLTVKSVANGAQQFTLKDGSVWTYNTKTKTFSTTD